MEVLERNLMKKTRETAEAYDRERIKRKEMMAYGEYKLAKRGR